VSGITSLNCCPAPRGGVWAAENSSAAIHRPPVPSVSITTRQPKAANTGTDLRQTPVSLGTLDGSVMLSAPCRLRCRQSLRIKRPCPATTLRPAMLVPLNRISGPVAVATGPAFVAAPRSRRV